LLAAGAEPHPTFSLQRETRMSIKTATINGVATIEIARPEKKNALTVAMYKAMSEALIAAKEDKAVRAVLITGQPGIFTSGNDIEDFMSRPPGQGSDAMDSPVFLFMQALMNCDKPVVAAVTGAAIGIGTTLLLHCDLVYVSDEARLAMPFVSLGLVPEFGSSLLVPQLMGHRRAAEKLLLGEPITPEQAVEYGLANAVLPAGEVVNHARRMAERFNALPPGAVREAKQLMRKPQYELTLQTLRTEGALFSARLRSPEAMEAFQAFFQKRKPDFSKF
jgi:enoyl-CoA hydratase/carnithine racemase